MGQSIQLKKRIRSHFTRLKLNKHPNSRMQRLYESHGPSIFEFSILEYCSEDALNSREQYWFDYYKNQQYTLLNYGTNVVEPIKGITLGVVNRLEWRKNLSQRVLPKRPRKSLPLNFAEDTLRLQKSLNGSHSYSKFRGMASPSTMQIVRELKGKGWSNKQLSVATGYSTPIIRKILERHPRYDK